MSIPELLGLPSPVPANNAASVDLASALVWTDTVTPSAWDVYLGTQYPPPYFTTVFSTPACAPGTFKPNQRYYWQVVAYPDPDHPLVDRLIGPIWSFTTALDDDTIPNSPSPADGAVNVNHHVTLSWACARAIRYDLYGGTVLSSDGTLPLVIAGLENASYAPSDLAYNQRYYWKIHAFIQMGGADSPVIEQVGPVWSFVTYAGELGATPGLFVQWSDDGGHTWSSTHRMEAGESGQFRTRAVLRRLGRSRDRVFRVSMTDPVKWVLIDALLEIEGGLH